MSTIRSVAKRAVDTWMPSVGQAYRSLRDERPAWSPALQTTFFFKQKTAYEMASGIFEKKEINLFLKHLQRASTCVDIGANIGFYTCLAASHGKHVVAIEPMPGNLKFLYRNLIRNDF